MRNWLRSPVLVLLVITTFYLSALLWADRQQGLSQGLGAAMSYAPYLLIATLVSYAFRFYRWWWLLNRAGYSLPIAKGLLSYLAGFAYTATPGKVGELIRIRYFAKFGVPAECTFGAFVFERSCDLVAVLLLSLFIVNNSEILLVSIGFVLVIVGSILLCALKPAVLQSLERFFAKLRIPLIPKALAFLHVGISHCRSWFNIADIAMGLVMGLAAWSVVGLSFVYLQSHFTDSIPFLEALSIYPLSMLVGAASMIPGGVGSTEGAIMLLMGQYGVPVAISLLLSIVIRISTLWFGIVIGFFSLLCMEFFLREEEKYSF